MTDTTELARTNGTGTGTPGERTMSKRDRRAMADEVRLRARFLTLSSLDRRTSSFKRAQSLIDQMTADAGGDPTTAQRLLIERAALAAVMTEHEEARFLSGAAVAPEVHATLSNSLRRLLEAVGLQRVPKDAMSLDQYLASTEHHGNRQVNGQAATGQEVVTVPARALEDWSEEDEAHTTTESESQADAA